MKFTINIDSPSHDLGPEHHINEYKPTPAEEHLPEWFKGLTTNDTMKTAKTCRGLYDIMTSGYMVVWPFDVTITRDENNKLFVKRTRDDNREGLFSSHPQVQLGMYPDAAVSMQKFGVEKVVLPYKVKTSKNTSIMMIQPPYRPDLKTEVMPGIIDTDKFYTPLNVLFTIKPFEYTREVKIAAGTPLAQIIPFVRSAWEIGYNKIDSKLDQITQENIQSIDRYYQKKLWTRKLFKRKVQ